MRTFYSEREGKAITHETLKAAAGSDQFVLTFTGNTFETDNAALADALAALLPNLQGVTETTPEAEKPNAAKRK